MIRYLVIGFIALAPTFFYENDWGWFWTPALSFLSLILTGKAGFSLLVGSISGVLFLKQGDIWQSYLSLFTEHLSPILSSSWKMGSLTFTILLGGFAALLDKTGGFNQLIQWITGKSKSKIRVELAAALTGLICFFDGLASNLMIGKLNLSSFDKAGIARWRLAYIADTTGSCVACIAIFSTWIATQISLIDEGLKTNTNLIHLNSPYSLFIQSIPYNFYCIFALLILFIGISRNWNLTRLSSSAGIKDCSTDTLNEPEGKLSTVLIPIAALVLSISCGFYIDGNQSYLPITVEKVSNAFSQADTMKILNISALISIAITAFLLMKQGKSSISISERLRSGIVSMLQPLLILIAAWLLGSVISDLGTTMVLSSFLDEFINARWFSLGVFLLCMILSFSTGTSWGTMGLIMPICLPIIVSLCSSQNLDPQIFILQTIGAVFGGAVFGDHCSPFSDTTIVSSIASKITPTEHIKTQLPYAIFGAVITLICAYIPNAFGIHWSICYLLGIGGIILTIRLSQSFRKQNLNSFQNNRFYFV